MRTTLLQPENLPDFDVDIVRYVNEKGANLWGSSEMLIGIQFNGRIYRQIICEGMTEYIGCTQDLPDFGLTAIPAVKPYDDVFAKD